MSATRRRFSVTVPDWGQDHLSSDAIVAYVDNELARGPHMRATQHLAACPECAGQVVAQGQARSAVRSAEYPSLPSALLSSLRSIPQDTDLPGAPSGLAMSADGQFVTVLRPERMPAPIADAADDEKASSAPTSHLHGRRRMKLGAGAAVSGLALGALAFGAPGFGSAPAPTVPAERGVFNGPVVGGSNAIDAQLRITPERPDELRDRIERTPGSFLWLR